MKEEDSVSIFISKNLFERICQEINSTDLQTVSKYIAYILKKELTIQQRRVPSEQEKEKAKEKLHELGYF